MASPEHAADTVWRSVLEPEVVDWFRDHPRPPGPEFHTWVSARADRLISELGGMTTMAQEAIDALHEAAADAVAGRVWERWARVGVASSTGG